MTPETLCHQADFLKNLILVFQSINMAVDHKLLLQLFLIDFCLFCSKSGER